jgi:hypothetical protein
MAKPVKDFLATVGTSPSPDQVAEGLRQHLSEMRIDQLPDAAHIAWREFAQCFKADAAKALPARAIASVASWPRDRIARLIEAARRLDEILDRIENERLEDEVRDSIRHHYL